MPSLQFRRAGPAALLLALSAATGAGAQTLAPTFAADYTITDLGSVSGLPSNYGGLTFVDLDTIVIGGSANTGSGLLYQVDVVRGVGGHITGFSGTAAPFRAGTIGVNNDGGVTFGPGGVLFTTRYPVNGLGQTKPGSTVEDKVINLTSLGVDSSVGAVGFVPGTFSGAGQIKLASYNSGAWYSATLTPDGSGTYDITGLTLIDVDLTSPGTQKLTGGPEGFVYIPAGNAQFAANSLLLSEYSAGVVSAFEVDGNGDPIQSTRRPFITGLTGAEGAAIDPVTGDFLFSTFGGGSRLVLVSGFISAVPEPATWACWLLGGAAVLARVRRRRAA